MSEVIVGYRQEEPVVTQAVEGDASSVVIDCASIYYRQVNEAIRTALAQGATTIRLKGINGQRYIGDGITDKNVTIYVEGVAGQDLAMFMGGAQVVVEASAQDGVGNTMDSGRVEVHGNAGDVVGYGMRGGRVMIRGDVGYRVGIHMKEFKTHKPLIIAGGCARDFFGEYMAGGELILLGLDEHGTCAEQDIVGNYIGTGMHGGVIYVRGGVTQEQCGKEVGIFEADETDKAQLKKHLEAYSEAFSADFGCEASALVAELLDQPWSKLVPVSSRPYGNLYTTI